MKAVQLKLKLKTRTQGYISNPKTTTETFQEQVPGEAVEEEKKSMTTTSGRVVGVQLEFESLH